MNLLKKNSIIKDDYQALFTKNINDYFENVPDELNIYAVTTYNEKNIKSEYIVFEYNGKTIWELEDYSYDCNSKKSLYAQIESIIEDIEDYI